MTGSPWPEPHVDTLRTLWGEEGLYPSEIARELNRLYGAGYTRNSVIGKIHRMGWIEGSATAPKTVTDPKAPSRKAVVDLSKSHSTPRPRGGSTPHPSQAPKLAPARAANDSTYQAMQRHVSGSCSWPIGDPRDEGFHLCGAPRTRGAYCAEHAAKGYQAGTALNAKGVERAARRFQDRNVRRVAI